MQQEKVKLEIIKLFTNSLEVKDGKLITTLDEDDYYEFKKSFHCGKSGISKDYLKTIAGLANNKGGLIIFGIDPVNQELVGIKESYNNLDNKFVNMVVSEFLDGLCSFYFFTYKHEEKLIGFLKIYEPVFKPVIVRSNFTTDGEHHSAGDIYYRYPGEDLKIKPSDLRTLMSKEINRHAEQLISQITKLVEIGPENAAIINSKTGEIDANHSKLMLSPEILKDLNLIMEGNFVEKDGAPAYIIKGNIELESGGSVSRVIKEKVHTTLHNRDYHNSLLDDECINPKGLLEDIVYRDTSYLPIFNLLKKAKLTNLEAIELINTQNNADIKKATKTKIIDRLKNPDICKSLQYQGTIKEEITEINLDGNSSLEKIKKKYDLKGNSDKSIIRTVFFNQLKQGIKVEHQTKKENLKEFIEAFSHLSKEELTEHKKFYCSEFKTALGEFNDLLSSDGPTKTAFRKTICVMDYLLNT